MGATKLNLMSIADAIKPGYPVAITFQQEGMLTCLRSLAVGSDHYFSLDERDIILWAAFQASMQWGNGGTQGRTLRVRFKTSDGFRAMVDLFWLYNIERIESVDRKLPKFDTEKNYGQHLAKSVLTPELLKLCEEWLLEISCELKDTALGHKQIVITITDTIDHALHEMIILDAWTGQITTSSTEDTLGFTRVAQLQQLVRNAIERRRLELDAPFAPTQAT